MTTRRRNTIIAASIAIGLIAILAAAVFWPSEMAEEAQLISERDVPAPRSQAWSKTNAEESIQVDLEGQPITWSSESQLLLEGPAIEGVSWQWEQSSEQGWNVVIGVGEKEGVQALTHIWTTPNLPAAIIDIEALISGEALATPLEVLLNAPTNAAQAITASLSLQEFNAADAEQLSIQGARFTDIDPVLQLHSPGGALGILDTSDDTAQTNTRWTLWPAPDDILPCLIEEKAPRRVTLRLILSFGEQPALLPRPVPHPARGLRTPIFTDPPRRSEDPWADGRSKDALEFSRRLRALAFGHSDSNDPRYANGGLLAAGMGAVFAIPAPWWESEPIHNLRDSLSDTGIELIPAGHTEEVNSIPAGARFASEFHCSSLASDAPPAEPNLILIPHNEPRAFGHPLATPLPTLVELGQAALTRQQLLDRLFGIDQPDSLFASGHHRILRFPVVATRNPLEDIAAEEILSPDRGGHWTLHDSLTRRFSMWEFTPESAHYRSISFEELRAFRWRHSESLPFWEPDGSLTFHPALEDQHLLFLGADEYISGLTPDQEGPLPSWQGDTDDEESPTYDGYLTPLNFQFLP